MKPYELMLSATAAIGGAFLPSTLFGPMLKSASSARFTMEGT